MRFLWQTFILILVTGCSIDRDNDINSPKLDNDLPKFEASAIDYGDSNSKDEIINNILMKSPSLRAEKIKGLEASAVFSGSLSFCTKFSTFEPYIILDNSWFVYEDKKFISTVREFTFSEKGQSDSFAIEANKWAEMFYTLPRSMWNRNNVNCWPNHTDKFYAVIHKGKKVMLIGDGDQYNYWFEAGDSIRDFHSKNDTDFYKFLNTIKNQN